LYSPKWSKAKRTLKGFICEPLKDRVDFHIINYRKAPDQLGRAVITVDNKEILSMCTIKSNMRRYQKENEIIQQQNNFENIDKKAHEHIKIQGIYAQYDFFDALEQYFNAPIEKSLKSTDMVIKILCLIDRRVGKRTLYKLRETIEKENDIIKFFYQLRCDAEGVR